MSFKAILSIDGKRFNLLSVSYSFNRHVSYSGYVGNLIRFNSFSLVLANDSDTFFLNWMFSSSIQKKGSISFYEDEDMIKKVKQIFFAGAFCISYNENFNSFNKSQSHITVKISAGGVKIHEGEFRFPWYKGPFKADVSELLMKTETEVVYVEDPMQPKEPNALTISSISKPVLPVASELPKQESLEGNNQIEDDDEDQIDYFNNNAKVDFKDKDKILVEERNIGLRNLGISNGQFGWYMVDTKSKAKFTYIHMPIDGSGGPEMSIFRNEAKIYDSDLLHSSGKGLVYVELIAKDFGWTKVGIKAMIYLYKNEFTFPPDNLPGTIVSKNKKNYEKEYVKVRNNNINLNDNEIAVEAIKLISFGIHRIEEGYGDIQVTLTDYYPVKMDGKIEMIPEIVKINAYLTKKP